MFRNWIFLPSACLPNSSSSAGWRAPHWPAPEERLGWKRLLAAEGEEAARLLAALAQTDAVDEIIASGDCVSLKTLAVSGRDFPLLRGPALGQLLNRLLEHVLQAPADNNRETLLELSKKFESPS